MKLLQSILSVFLALVLASQPAFAATNGDMALQYKNNVSITGGTIAGVTITGSTVAITEVTGNLFTLGSTTIAPDSTITAIAGLTLNTPTIANFTNATHNHQGAAGGGLLAGASTLSDYSTAFVTSVTGTANQVIFSAANGTVTASLPQSIGTSSNPQFATIELGAASDTTLARLSAGQANLEGVQILTASNTVTITGKSIAVSQLTGTLSGANGGTNLSTFGAANRIPYAASTTALTTSSGLTFDGTTLLSTGISIGSSSTAALLYLNSNVSAATFSTTNGQALAVTAATYNDTGAVGTRASWAATDFGTPTVTGSNAVTITQAATLRIEGAPVASTNITIGTAYGFHVAGGLTRIDGRMGLSANATAALTIAATANSGTTYSATQASMIQVNAATSNDGGSAGTRAVMPISLFGTPTITSTNSVTVSDAVTVYIAAAPVQSTNVTLTRTHALFVAAGDSTFNGGVTLGAGTTTVQPLKLTSGTSLTTPVNGSFEYDGTNLFYTRASATRQTIPMEPTTGSNATAINAARQVSTAHGAWVCASINIQTATAGDGKVEMLIGTNSDGTTGATVSGTFRLQAGTGLAVQGGGQIVGYVPAGSYYYLKSTNTTGTNTFTVVGNVMEYAH